MSLNLERSFCYKSKKIALGKLGTCLSDKQSYFFYCAFFDHSLTFNYEWILVDERGTTP